MANCRPRGVVCLSEVELSWVEFGPLGFIFLQEVCGNGWSRMEGRDGSVTVWSWICFLNCMLLFWLSTSVSISFSFRPILFLCSRRWLQFWAQRWSLFHSNQRRHDLALILSSELMSLEIDSKTFCADWPSRDIYYSILEALRRFSEGMGEMSNHRIPKAVSK